jgi:hypothetical protein
VASKEHILLEIRRIADECDGVAPGKERFAKETGVREHEWRGRYWAKWSDAVREAGCTTNTMSSRLDEGPALAALASEVRRLGMMPTSSEMMLWRQAEPSAPTVTWYQRRFGSKAALVVRLRTFCVEEPEFHDVAALLPSSAPANAALDPEDVRTVGEPLVGFVYLLRSGRYYKIGRSNSVGRRERELSIQLPQRVTRVHAISTDDPVGIERYWHVRFADRRVRPDAEWFELRPDDLAAFKRRKFQ